MYMFPGYIEFSREENSVHIFSQLLRNEVRIWEPQFQAELQTLIQNGGCEQVDTVLTHFLHEQEFLLQPKEIENSLQKVKQRLHEVLMITILPTEGCNFRCPYCYEDHKPVTMQRDVLVQIQKYIKEQVPHYKRIQLGWFGGEPTLCKEVVLETSLMVRNLQKQYHFEFHSSMTTNGYLLDEDSFKQYFKAGITSYQVTLDGWEHDKTRPLISGKGTLHTIIKNLLLLSKLSPEEYPFRMNLRHNILAGDEDYSWYGYLQRLFGEDERFSIYVHTVGDWGGETVHTLEVPRAEMKESLLSSHVNYLDKIGMRRQNGKGGLFSRICYASYPHSVVFRADGSIEKCTVALNHPQNHYGKVDPVKGVTLNSEGDLLWSSSEIKEECYTCPEVLSCLNLRCRKPIVVDGKPSECSRKLIAIS